MIGVPYFEGLGVCDSVWVSRAVRDGGSSWTTGQRTAALLHAMTLATVCVVRSFGGFGCAEDLGEQVYEYDA